jgi:hypothetical protein
MPPVRIPLPVLPIAIAAIVCTAMPASATWQDEIGYNQLAAELGNNLPRGAGVSVTHVEADENGEYAPSDVTHPTSGVFAGKAFSLESGPSALSGHAFRVGSFIYGANTNAALGDASVAPSAGLAPNNVIDSFSSDDWLADGFLKPGLAVPVVEPNAVSNHSWINYTDPGSPAEDLNDLLRRLDFSIERDDYLCVAGLNNGVASAVPELLAGGYNVLAIGLTDGNHSTGVTPAGLDGPGRVKPDLVAPLNRTSWATAVVSSCGAMLFSHAASTPGLGDGTRAEVLRALLLAGATKSEFPGWANSGTRPLDAHFGAGEVNVRRSYRLLVGGSHGPGSSQLVPLTGWDFAPGLTAGSQRTYAFRIPQNGLGADVSIALTWNRRVGGAAAGRLDEPVPQLPELDLFLHQSQNFSLGNVVASSRSGTAGSVAHNIEHIYLTGLPAGEYTLRVTNAPTESFTSDYALAWLVVPAPAAQPEISSRFSPNGGTLNLTASNLSAGLPYQWQHSIDLINWNAMQSVVPAGDTATLGVAIAPGAPRGFYRLIWTPP